MKLVGSFLLLVLHFLRLRRCFVTATILKTFKFKSVGSIVTTCAISSAILLNIEPTPVDAASMDLRSNIRNMQSKYGFTQSKGWELARQKRTAAIKQMQSQGILKVDTDDAGNQFLSLPWIPDRKLPYKSLSVRQRLTNEVCAGALGEICKDALLYSVDTMKTRRQARTSTKPAPASSDNASEAYYASSAGMEQSVGSNMQGGGAMVFQSVSLVTSATTNMMTAVKSFPALYAGFPIVALASIPQGGVFFLVKKGFVELFALKYTTVPAVVADTVPIILGVMAYWLFRTPAEVIKTRVQTGQVPSVSIALKDVFSPSAGDNSTTSGSGFLSLYQRYPVMLSLDIPFQLVNFVLYGWLSDVMYTAPAGLHWQQTITTRLLSGISCGMVAAAVTCPLDVCKTRMIARQRARTSPVPVNGSGEDGTDATLATDNVTLTITSVTDADPAQISLPPERDTGNTNNVLQELYTIATQEGIAALFLGFGQRLLYTGLANGIRLSAYGTSRMDLMMRSLERM